MQVFIRTVSGCTFTCSPLYPWSTIASVKTLIRGKEGIPEDQQRLFYKGVRQEDGRTLESCGVTKESTIHLVPELRGD